jgi:hypothetical protein
MGPAALPALQACLAPWEIELKLRLFAAAPAALLSLLALAQDAADPAAVVPRPAYRSIFEGLPRGVEEASVPWKDANAAVAEFPRGHVDLLKWEERHGAPAPAGPRQDPVPPAPAPRHVH